MFSDRKYSGLRFSSKMSDNEYEIEQDQENFTYPREAGDLKKNDYIVLKGGPCKIVETHSNNTGKHGHSKSKIIAINIFTGSKVEDVMPSSQQVDCPEVVRKDFELVSIDKNGSVTFLNEKGEYVENLKLPGNCQMNDFVPKLKKDYEKGIKILLSVTKAMGKLQIVGYRENKK